MRIARFVLFLVIAAGILAMPAPSHAQVAVGVSIRIGPPALPVYAQPICPGPGYLWAPGYWSYDYDDEDYFWVPGTWVVAPEPGYLWTPGYWGWSEGFYIWHAGYWGPHVGFYGGIDYGFGYPGTGFYGGYWRGDNYYYNRSVTNINVTNIHNVYNKTVINERTENRVSFNGGPGGVRYEPNRDERRAEHERHFERTSEQNRNFEAARGDRSFRNSVNHGNPEVAATPRSGDFHGRDVEHGRAQDNRGRIDDRGGFNDRGRGNDRNNDRNRPPDARDSNRRDRNFDNGGRNPSDSAGRGRENNGREFDRPPSSRHSDNPTSNPRLEQRHEQQFDKMQRQQDAERQKMQRRNEQEQQKLSRQNANQQRQDQLQRRQQQQMDQMDRRQQQQTQKLQQRQERDHQNERSQENKSRGNGHGKP